MAKRLKKQKQLVPPDTKAMEDGVAANECNRAVAAAEAGGASAATVAASSRINSKEARLAQTAADVKAVVTNTERGEGNCPLKLERAWA